VRHVRASWFPVRVHGRIVRVRAVVSDITGRKQPHLRLHRVVQQLPVGVLIVDVEGRERLGNQELADMGLTTWTGEGAQLGESEFVGWRADGRPYAVADYPLFRTLRTGAVIRGEEITYVRADGARRTIEASSAPIIDAGEVVAGVAVIQDVTERKQ